MWPNNLLFSVSRQAQSDPRRIPPKTLIAVKQKEIPAISWEIPLGLA